MYGILLSALNAVLGWVFKKLIVKFVVIFACYFVISEFVNALTNIMNGQSACCSIAGLPSAIRASMAALPSGMWYFLDLMAFTQGACIVVSCLVARFLIRRIPFIG